MFYTRSSSVTAIKIVQKQIKALKLSALKEESQNDNEPHMNYSDKDSNNSTPSTRDVSGTKSHSYLKKGIPLQLEHNKQQKAVVAAFKHAWKAYKEYAWGCDELMPLSKTAHTWFNLGLTLIDSLDTMWLMGLEEEFQESQDWVANKLIIAQDHPVNLFETTIRVLGGLLSAYHLTEDDVFLNKSVSTL